LKPGSNFITEIENSIENSLLVLVLIDKNWINIKNDKGERKLFDEKDFVRHEIKVALEKEKEIIPILFENGSMPSKKELPKVIRGFTDKQWFTIHADTVMQDIAALAELIKSKRKFFFDEGTITGVYERLARDPVNTIKKVWEDQSERYKK